MGSRTVWAVLACVLFFNVADFAGVQLCVDEVKQKDADSTMTAIAAEPAASANSCIVACLRHSKPVPCKSVIYVGTSALKRGMCKMYGESAKQNLVDASSALNEATYYELLDNCPDDAPAKKSVAGNFKQRDLGTVDAGAGGTDGNMGGIDGGVGGASANVDPPPPPGVVSSGGGGGGSYMPKPQVYQPKPQTYQPAPAPAPQTYPAPAPAPAPQTYQPKPQTYPAPAPAPVPAPQTYPAPAPAPSYPAPAPAPQTYQPKPQTYPAPAPAPAPSYPAPAPAPQTYQPKPQTYPAPAPAPSYPAPAPAPAPQTYQPPPKQGYMQPQYQNFYRMRNSGQ